MIVRRWLGTLTLLAMAHFVVVGNAAACVPPVGDAHAAATASEHADCAPASSHGDRGSKDLAPVLPCCVALASCGAVPLASQGEALATPAPLSAITYPAGVRVPRAELPAPELPPPKA